MPNQKFTIRGKTYNLAEAADLVSIQNALVPDNWPGKKPDGVRHFLAIQEMLGVQIRRYVAAKYQKIAKAALTEGADGGESKMKVTFAFEIDFTSPLVAALADMKLSFSVRDVLEGKPQTVDLTQANFFEVLEEQEADMTPVMDTGSVEREVEQAAAQEAQLKAQEKDTAKTAKADEKAAKKAEKSAAKKAEKAAENT